MKTSTCWAAAFALFALLYAGVALAQDSTAAPSPPVRTTAPAAKAAPRSKSADGAKARKISARTEGRIRTIVGEVIDPACYLVNGAHGEGHKECATACAKAGQTLAILERKTNKVYLLLTDHPGRNPNEKVMDYIAQIVTVRGKLYTRGGVTGLMVQSVEPGGGE